MLQTLSRWCVLWGFRGGRNHLLGSLAHGLMNLKWRDWLLESVHSIIIHSHGLSSELPSCFVKDCVHDEDRQNRTITPPSPLGNSVSALPVALWWRTELRTRAPICIFKKLVRFTLMNIKTKAVFSQTILLSFLFQPHSSFKGQVQWRFSFTSTSGLLSF